MKKNYLEIFDHKLEEVKAPAQENLAKESLSLELYKKVASAVCKVLKEYKRETSKISFFAGSMTPEERASDEALKTLTGIYQAASEGQPFNLVLMRTAAGALCACLGQSEEDASFASFINCLLDGSKPVYGLMKSQIKMGISGAGPAKEKSEEVVFGKTSTGPYLRPRV